MFLRVVCLVGIATSAFGAVRGAYYNHFAIEGDYVLLRRANSHNKHLVSAAGGPINFPVLSTSSTTSEVIWKTTLYIL